MPLVRADAPSGVVDGEPALGVRRDDLSQTRAIERDTVRTARDEQRIDIGPACGIERDADRVRRMAQMFREEFTDPYPLSLIHRVYFRFRLVLHTGCYRVSSGELSLSFHTV